MSGVARERVRVVSPRLWWRATSADICRTFLEDPDVEDGKRRHGDRDEQRWQLIAAIVARVGDALAAEGWIIDSDDEGHGYVALDGLGELTETEWRIVGSWFAGGEPVRFDPGADVFSGRHRLWGTLPHFGAALVPVFGITLSGATPADIEVYGPRWPEIFAQQLEELHAVAWFDSADPLNVRYRAALAAAASGELPPHV